MTLGKESSYSYSGRPGSSLGWAASLSSKVPSAACLPSVSRKWLPPSGKARICVAGRAGSARMGPPGETEMTMLWDESDFTPGTAVKPVLIVYPEGSLRRDCILSAHPVRLFPLAFVDESDSR